MAYGDNRYSSSSEDLRRSYSEMVMSMMRTNPFISDLGSDSITIDDKPEEKKPPKTIPVTWDDVIGLEDAKAQLQEAIEAPILHKDIYEQFNMTPPKGVLLYGPPGCGKTLIGKAAASALGKLHKKDVFDGFFYYNGAEMFGPHVGCEEKWIREAFDKAESFHKRNGFPAILFFDEADSMLPRREISPPWTRNAVNQFLSLMDGAKTRTAFVILATNMHTMLDEAAIRAGRIDRKIYVGPPTKEAGKQIITRSFSKKPLQDGVVDYVVNAIYEEPNYILEKQFSEFVNGANAASLADSAASIAFNRALKEDPAKRTLMVTVEDAKKAVSVLFAEIVEFSKGIEKIKDHKMSIDINHKIQPDGKDQDLF